MNKTRETDRFEEKLTGHIRAQAADSSVIRAMYYYDPVYENLPANRDRDILLEKENSPVKGLVHKFANRVAVFLSYTCAANCRYCERQDRVGVGLDQEGRLKIEHIDDICAYITAHPEITEVVLSGGDPLTNPIGLKYFCNLLKKIATVRTIRIHTKLPVQAPNLVDFKMLEAVADTKDAFYLSLHINHPDELAGALIDVIRRLRQMGVLLLSQSVFLKGINDDASVLAALFTQLTELGVRPYYIYHCQSIPTTTRFMMTIDEERAIMTDLREMISGIAYPSHVIDLQDAVGKVIVPTTHWSLAALRVKDYNGKDIDLEHYDN